MVDPSGPDGRQSCGDVRWPAVGCVLGTTGPGSVTLRMSIAPGSFARQRESHRRRRATGRRGRSRHGTCRPPLRAIIGSMATCQARHGERLARLEEGLEPGHDVDDAAAEVLLGLRARDQRTRDRQASSRRRRCASTSQTMRTGPSASMSGSQRGRNDITTERPGRSRGPRRRRRSSRRGTRRSASSRASSRS